MLLRFIRLTLRHATFSHHAYPRTVLSICVAVVLSCCVGGYVCAEQQTEEADSQAATQLFKDTSSERDEKAAGESTTEREDLEKFTDASERDNETADRDEVSVTSTDASQQEASPAKNDSGDGEEEISFQSFSAAFVSVLKNIEQEGKQKRPTPAGDEKSNVTKTAVAKSTSPAKVVVKQVAPKDVAQRAGKDKKASLQDIAGDKDANASSSEVPAKKRIDLASEVSKTTVSIQSPALKPILKPEVIEPSVAKSARSEPTAVPNTDGAKSGQLNQELDQYFQNLKQEPKRDRREPKPSVESAIAKTQDPTPALPGKPEPGKPEPPGKPAVTPNRIPPAEPPVRITRQMAALQPRVAKALRFYFNRPLNTADDSAWSVMHSMLGYGPRGQVAVGGSRGPRSNVVHWMCQNGLCANRRLLYLQDGYIYGLEGPGYQGHPGQFLAMLAQIGIERDYPLNVQGQDLTVDALVNSEMYTCDSSKELTFKLISLSYYLDSTAKWKSKNGEIWDLPKMVNIEMSQPVNGAACGGTHRIMSISYAIRNRWVRSEPMTGVYAQAEQYVRKYQQYALSLQNRDGSFSSEWFKRPASSKDRDRQLQTTGHILEWLVYTLPRNELSDPRIVKAVDFLTNLMTRHRYHDWEVGPRGHAIRALSLYHQRVFERRRPNIPRMANTEIWSEVLR